MEPYFVFQHSFAALTDNEIYEVSEIFNHNGVLTPSKQIEHTLLGKPCLFKQDLNQNGFNIGQLVLDEDLNPHSIQSSTVLDLIKFPIAEYHYTTWKGPFNQIRHAYSAIESDLHDENLEAIYHPIMVLPLQIAPSPKDNVLLEIWTATNASLEGEYRRSERIQEALPRTSYNFYTW